LLNSLVSRNGKDFAVLHAAATKERNLEPRRDLLSEGDVPSEGYLILEGWGLRYKDLDEGRRQILAFLLPGDLCLNLPDVPMSHCVGSLTNLRYGVIPQRRLGDAAASSALAGTLWRQQLAASAIQLEWLANSGRPAYEATAHLLCELFARAQAAGLASGNCCEFPVTQFDLACALGLTSVHVNRTLQQLRRDGLIELRGRKLCLLDSKGLREAAQFDRTYLHLSAA
jgi:CRP-like cAMP-binding protein